MPPRTRSRRAERLEIAQIFATGGNINRHGLAALPNELFLELLAQMPASPLPRRPWMKIELNPDRHFTLVSLSQTCRSLRDFFLPHAWKRLEVFDGMTCINGPLYTREERHGASHQRRKLMLKRHVAEAFRQLDIVTVRNPNLAQFVRELDIFIPRLAPLSIIEKLAISLDSLPHVHTVQLAIEVDYKFNSLKIFLNHNYPSIRTICLARFIMDFLEACPNVRHVFDATNGPFSQDIDPGPWWGFLGDVVRKCPNAIAIGPLVPHTAFSSLPGTLPALVDVTIKFDITHDDESFRVAQLVQLKNLHTIRLDFFEPIEIRRDRLGTMRRQRTNLVRDILPLLPAKGVQKKLVVIREDGTLETFVHG